MKRIISLILVFVFSFCLAGCAGNAGKSDKEDKAVIAVSIVPQATFVEKIVGDEFEVVTMIPAGASPETYEPTPLQMQKTEDAVFFFAIGVPAEESFMISEKTERVNLHEMILVSHKELEIDGGRDPHIWLSPKRVMAMVSIISEKLGEKYPEKAEEYNQNALKYIEELEKLDQEIVSLLGEARGKGFMAFHPAFGYFADEYGLKMYALEEHGKEATAKRISDMVELAKKENIKVIFYQAESSGKQAKVFADEIGGKAVSLEPLAADYVDNLRNMAKAISEAVKK